LDQTTAKKKKSRTKPQSNNPSARRRKAKPAKPTKSTKTAKQITPARTAKVSSGLIQFDWKKEWRKKVKPHLQNPFVEYALGIGMLTCDDRWQPNDPPYRYGAIGLGGTPRKGSLAWYQPLCRCHYIAYFSLAIGVINYPELTWKLVIGKLHTVPVGYDEAGKPRVVMDILQFSYSTAEESIELALREKDTATGWDALYNAFETVFVSGLRGAVTDKENRLPVYYFDSTVPHFRQMLLNAERPQDPSSADAV
jgi:hypothetical protein